MNQRNIEVAKFGGTSMARLDLVTGLLQHNENHVDVVVTSAAGKDDDHTEKTTDMLIDYAQIPTEAKRFVIQDRIADAARIADPNESNQRLWNIVEQVPDDIISQHEKGYPVPILGEYWSARMLAELTDYDFLDSRELIMFKTDGTFDEQASYNAITQKIDGSRPLIVPGYYGIDPSGRDVAFDRGGTDTSGAILSKELSAPFYHVWSDVKGCMSADPRKVSNATLLSDAAYREARELGNGGSELLNRTAIKILGNTATKTLLRDTFSNDPLNIGTTVSKTRDWRENPIAAVTSRNDLLMLTLHEFGLHEEVGTTAEIYQQLKKDRIPYEHTATATDDVAIFLSKEYKNGIKKIEDRIGHLTRKSAGMIHIVGEGLAQSSTERFRVIGKVATTFAKAGIDGLGLTDVAGSAAMTIFIDPSSVAEATLIAHDVLELGR